MIDVKWNLVKAKLLEREITLDDLSSKMGITRQSIYLKMNNSKNMKLHEIDHICNILELTPADLILYNK